MWGASGAGVPLAKTYFRLSLAQVMLCLNNATNI